MSFCSTFLQVYNVTNYFSTKKFDKVIAKNKTAQFFFLPHSVKSKTKSNIDKALVATNNSASQPDCGYSKVAQIMTNSR